MRPSFQTVIHSPSEKARIGQLFVPDQVRYLMDTAACGPGYHEATPAGCPGGTTRGRVANLSQRTDAPSPTFPASSLKFCTFLFPSLVSSRDVHQREKIFPFP